MAAGSAPGNTGRRAKQGPCLGWECNFLPSDGADAGMTTGPHLSCVWASSGQVPLGEVPGC